MIVREGHNEKDEGDEECEECEDEQSYYKAVFTL